MIEKHTFITQISLLKDYNKAVNKMDDAIDIGHDSWLFHLIDNWLESICTAFYTYDEYVEYIRKNSKGIADNIIELVFHFCFNGDFGENIKPIKHVYSRDDGKWQNILNSAELYDVIIDYITHPESKFEFDLTYHTKEEYDEEDS